MFIFKNNKFKCHGAVKITLTVLSGKWKALILWHLFQKKMRFNELQRHLNGISQKVLAKELRALEKEKIIHREIYLQVPPKVEYWITPYGKSLGPILMSLAEWGHKHSQKK